MKWHLRLSKRGKRRLVAAVLCIGIAAGVGYYWINENLRPALIGFARARVEAAAAKAMNDAILESFQDESVYSDLMQVHQTDEKVYFLQTNSVKLNAIAASCAESAQQRIADIGGQGIDVPMGTLSGIPVFTGSGPLIRMTFTPVGSVTASFDTQFRSAGINQTLYYLYLQLTASVQIVLPGAVENVTVIAQAPISQSVIVGDVPDGYTDVANEEDMLNLIPYQ